MDVNNYAHKGLNDDVIKPYVDAVLDIMMTWRWWEETYQMHGNGD